MARQTPPTRLPKDIYDSASASAPLNSRTVPQQIAHWTRLGREIEMSPGVSLRQIKQVLDGAGVYDALTEHEQAIVRQEWARRMKARREQLNYAAEFAAAGRSYSEADEDSNVIIHSAD